MILIFTRIKLNIFKLLYFLNVSDAPDDTDDSFDAILKKIQFLAIQKTLGTPRSKAGDKKKKKPSVTSIPSAAIGSSTMFDMVI